MGYLVTLTLFSLALLLGFLPHVSTKIRHAGELVQCFSIRGLLLLQPWLSCEENFPGIARLYSKFGTRRVLFVANHRSNMDTFLLISLIPGLRGLAKKSLFQNIFFAPFMWAAGFIPVEKGDAHSFIQGLLDVRVKLLEQDRPVLFFPENTRCDKGFPSVRKFGSSIFGVAINSHALIVPIAITDTDLLMGRGDLLVNPYRPVRLKMLEPVRAVDFTDASELAELVRARIAAEIETAPA